MMSLKGVAVLKCLVGKQLYYSNAHSEKKQSFQTFKLITIIYSKDDADTNLCIHLYPNVDSESRCEI